MIYLQIKTSIADDETICFGPVFTDTRVKRVRDELQGIESQFNQQKDCEVRLLVGLVDHASEPLFADGHLRALGAAVQAMLSRQYREQYEEMQNV